ncbi:MAG: diguanylate cyclase and metal dependent phosphohydrolase [Symbiobacteriaceae bacterium]|jgi:diguanylate cyclase (GGDEF)-like protein/putative nucleotidyltransferase with HDIG domain|nr:diguanylate cyclase and metal dependent phosphohydrolase [Symbiobacteriaceae bacterium]
MEGILRSIVAAEYRQLQGRGMMLFRYDPGSDSFPDQWRLVDGEIARRYSARESWGGMAALIFRSGQHVVVDETATAQPHGVAPFKDVRSFVGVPVVVDGVPWGVLYISSTEPQAFGDDDIGFVQSLARQIGALVHETIEGKFGSVELSTVRVLAATVDAKDHYTRHHSTNVSFYARSLAREMNLDPVEVRRIELAGLLHDIGKIAIPDQVLQKPGPLSAEEWLLIQTHASIGGNILAQASHLRGLVPLVRHHHEKYDGTGYPDGLKGEEIPLGAAILNLSDSFDTMTTRRIYRAPRSLASAVGELRRCSGTQFHPEVVQAFERVVEQALAKGEPWVLALQDAPTGTALAGDMAAWPLVEEAERPESPVHRDPMELLLEARLLHQITEQPVILHRAGEQAADFWSADAVQIYLLDESDCQLQLAWSGGAQTGQEFLALSRAEPSLPLTRGIVGWAAMTNQGATVPDARRDPRWAFGDVFHGPVSVMVSPITAGGKVMGVIEVLGRGESRFGRPDLKVLKVFGALTGHAVAAVQQRPVSEASLATDAQTGLGSGHYLRGLLEQLERNGWNAPLSVAFLDGDGLRSINERHGYEAGDQVIRHIARSLQAWGRPEDTVVRLGGDEFVVLFGGLTLPEASTRLERIRITISETPVELMNGRRIYVSVSCGVTEVDAELGPHKAVRASEQAMYNAKRTGKNRIWTVAG